MKASIKTITLLLLFSMIISCNETEILNLPSKPVMSDSLMLRVGKLGLHFPKKKSGRLYFETMEDFKSYMQTLTKLEAGYLQEYNKAHDFISWFDVMEADDSSAYYMQGYANNLYISDPWFASVLNQQREIQIKQLVFNYSNEFYFIYLDGHHEEINKFTLEYQSGKIPFRPESFYKFSNYLTVYFNQKVENEEKFRSDCYTNCNSISHFTGFRRFRGNIWRENFLVYASLGARTIFQRNVSCSSCCGQNWPMANTGWVLSTASKLTLTWKDIYLIDNCTLYPGGCFKVIPDGQMVGYNTSIVAKLFYEVYGFTIIINPSSGQPSPGTLDPFVPKYCSKQTFHTAKFQPIDPERTLTIKDCNMGSCF